MIKPQDLVVALKLFLLRGENSGATYVGLAHALHLSASEVHGAVKRGVRAGLVTRRVPRLASPRHPANAVVPAMVEFLVHGVKYVWPGEIGPVARGVQTAAAVPKIAACLDLAVSEAPLVWPFSEGTTRGESIAPLYAGAPLAALGDPLLHEWLALIDLVRMKPGREAFLATLEIQNRFRQWPNSP